MTLVLAMLLDAWLGEPKWLWSRMPHPAVLMGRAVGWCDARYNRGDNRRIKGVAAMAAMVLAAWGLWRHTREQATKDGVPSAEAD